MSSIRNPTFEVIRKRSSVRKFSTAEIPEPLLLELLELANQAPSGFNLQPWHFVLVRNPELKQIMRHLAMEQIQVAEAPAVVVFVADPDAWKNSYDQVLELGLRSRQMDARRVERYRKNVHLLFKNGPFGTFGLLKRIGVPIRRLFKPTPAVITSRLEAAQYVRSQTMLSAATFMIAAKAAGLETSPIEGFDEDRLKRLLAVPRSMTIPVIVAIGQPLDASSLTPTVRLPLEQKVSIDLFPNRLKATARATGKAPS